MCKKIWNESKKGLRTAIRLLEVGEELIIKNKPIKRPLSSIRVTASNVSADLGRKYSVTTNEGIVIVKRNH